MISNEKGACRNKLFFSIVGLLFVLFFCKAIYADEALPKDSFTLKSLTVIYEDGETQEVTKPRILYVVMPGYRPTRYSSCDSLKLIKMKTVKSVTTKEEKEIKLSDIASIEFRHNESGNCFGVINLLDGKNIFSKSNWIWDFDDEKTSEEYRGFSFDLKDHQPRLRGSVVTDGKEGTFDTDLFCPREKSAEMITKIIFNHKSSR